MAQSGGGVGGAPAVATVTVRQIVQRDGQQTDGCGAADRASRIRATLGVGQQRFEGGRGDAGFSGDGGCRQAGTLGDQMLDVVGHGAGVHPVGAHGELAWGVRRHGGRRDCRRPRQSGPLIPVRPCAMRRLSGRDALTLEQAGEALGRASSAG
ncbi:hypothetical protein [Streptomyces sp. NPDC053431]|uniref:hypothetical protein n=1 Tax=Streptomyces sp. NPDC053431 TaxID=3365703 RepID=UPI0037D760EA